MQQEHRKLAAIMFTDIAGYTALMARDEHMALEILRRNRDTIKTFVSQFSGEWLKEMGDGTLSSFGSVVDAVNCAIEIQHSLADETAFRLRIGIHIGDVVVEKCDVFGDGVNVAARIEKLAEPGGICVSGRVYEDIQNKPMISASYLGEKTLKNVGNPVKIYALKREESFTSSGAPVPNNAPLERTIPSIAVLPFVNMSADPEQEYFCDGMAEEIINALTHVENLLVVARTSAFSFKGKDVDIGEIGRRLKVAYVLEGSVRKAGNRLRITAQLIKVEDEYHQWSERYDRNLDDVFAIQDEISLAIVKELKGRILPQEEKRIKKRYSEDSIAHDWYLKGLRYIHSYNIDKSLECFQYAVRQDPGFAPAYFGIALYYIYMGYFGFKSPHEVYPRAKEAVSQALAIDEEIAVAHACLSQIFWCYEWDWSAAEKECKRAIELAPSSADSHLIYGIFLEKMGRSEEALNEFTDALHLDPLSNMIRTCMIYLFIRMGDFERAQESLRIAAALDANISYNFQQGVLAIYKGNYTEAAIIFEKTPPGDFSNWIDALLGYTYGRAGKREKAEKVLQTMLVRKREQFAPAIHIAFIYQGLGEYDRAFEWLEQAFEDRDPHMTHLYAYPEWDLLRSDPRFEALLKKMGFPE